jgi:AcrR family transcriptional regulator
MPQSSGGSVAAGEGLRERKKRLTRAALAANAQRLFRERGFDQVTVAEIAASANVSVKTLFVYFASKEDLVFADEFVLLDLIRERLAMRPAGTSPAQAVRALALELAAGTGLAEDGGDEGAGLTAFAALIGDHPALHARLLLMWERYEQALAETLAGETGASAVDARVRTAAALLVTPFRVLTSSDVRRATADRGVTTWIEDCFDTVEHGLGPLDES